MIIQSKFPRNLTNYRKLLIKWKRKTRLQSLRLAARRANGTNGLLQQTRAKLVVNTQFNADYISAKKKFEEGDSARLAAVMMMGRSIAKFATYLNSFLMVLRIRTDDGFVYRKFSRGTPRSTDPAYYSELEQRCHFELLAKLRQYWMSIRRLTDHGEVNQLHQTLFQKELGATGKMLLVQRRGTRFQEDTVGHSRPKIKVLLDAPDCSDYKAVEQSLDLPGEEISDCVWMHRRPICLIELEDSRINDQASVENGPALPPFDFATADFQKNDAGTYIRQENFLIPSLDGRSRVNNLCFVLKSVILKLATKAHEASEESGLAVQRELPKLIAKLHLLQALMGEAEGMLRERRNKFTTATIASKSESQTNGGVVPINAASLSSAGSQIRQQQDEFLLACGETFLETLTSRIREVLGGDLGSDGPGQNTVATNFSSIDARNTYRQEVFETVCQVFTHLTYENGITRVYLDCEFLERNLIEADLFMWPTMLRHRTFEHKLLSAREGFWAERNYMAPETTGDDPSHSPPLGGYFSTATIPSWLGAVAAIDRLPVGAHIKDEFYRILGRLLTGAGTADCSGSAEKNSDSDEDSDAHGEESEVE